MLVKLLKRARIWHNAGEIVQVSPDEANFLISVSAAAPARAEKVQKPKKGTKK